MSTKLNKQIPSNQLSLLVLFTNISIIYKVIYNYVPNYWMMFIYVLSCLDVLTQLTKILYIILEILSLIYFFCSRMPLILYPSNRLFQDYIITTDKRIGLPLSNRIKRFRKVIPRFYPISLILPHPECVGTAMLSQFLTTRKN